MFKIYSGEFHPSSFTEKEREREREREREQTNIFFLLTRVILYSKYIMHSFFSFSP